MTMDPRGSGEPEIAGQAPTDPPPAPLTVPDDYTPSRRQGVTEIEMGDGSILFDDDTSLVHHLNPSAALIWQLCDGTGTVAELARDISQEYGVPPTSLKEQIAAVIAEFDALELVEDAGDRAVDPKLRSTS
jgi:PqqD family protein of HPr-rel-A system